MTSQGDRRTVMISEVGVLSVCRHEMSKTVRIVDNFMIVRTNLKNVLFYLELYLAHES